MPKDFRLEEHGLKKLSVATRGGVVFASFDPKMPGLEDYLGAEMIRDFDATFDGRKLKILGYYRNTVPANWKMYHENLKDPYHATCCCTPSSVESFGLLVAGNQSAMVVDASGRHGTMASARPPEMPKLDVETKTQMRAFSDELRLAEPKFLDYVREFDSPWSVTMQTIWPNFVVQRELNTLGVRQIVPRGPNEFLMVWTMFGYEGDSDEMTRHRLRQGNLMGPSGFLGIEDNEAMRFVQQGVTRSDTEESWWRSAAPRKAPPPTSSPRPRSARSTATIAT